jgi:hypothetical protein
LHPKGIDPKDEFHSSPEVDTVDGSQRSRLEHCDGAHANQRLGYNPIEVHFGDVKDLAVIESDYRNLGYPTKAIHDEIRHRNGNAEPKVHNAKRRLRVRHDIAASADSV